MMHINDLLESVDFDDAARPSPTNHVRLLVADSKPGENAPFDAEAPGRPLPGSARAWPLGAG